MYTEDRSPRVRKVQRRKSSAQPSACDFADKCKWHGDEPFA